MRTKVGLWIDHRKAIVVTVTEKGEEIKEIISEVEKQPRRSGDSPLKGAYESHQVPADDSLQRTFTENSIFTMMQSLHIFVMQSLF